MEIIILIALAISIARYVYKRSKIIVGFYSLLFFSVFVLSLFTTDVVDIRILMQNVVGKESYNGISIALQKPCSFLYSVSAAITVAEIIIAIIFAIIVVERAKLKIEKYIRERVYKLLKTKNNFKETTNNDIFERKIFLRFCRLLN